MIARIAMKSIRMATPMAVPIGVLVMADSKSIEGCRCVTVAVHVAVTAGVLIAAKVAEAQVALEVDFEGGARCRACNGAHDDSGEGQAGRRAGVHGGGGASGYDNMLMGGHLDGENDRGQGDRSNPSGCRSEGNSVDGTGRALLGETDHGSALTYKEEGGSIRLEEIGPGRSGQSRSTLG
jgi:hypothetical protein